MDLFKMGEVTEVLGTELESGGCISSIGYTLNDEEILPYRLALTGAYKALFYPLNKNATQASATLGDIQITAISGGILGNEISVAIKANMPTAGKYLVETYFKGVKRESKYISGVEELLNLKSNWVVFNSNEASPEITPTPGIKLSGGTNGSVVEETIDGTKASKDIGSLHFEAKSVGAYGNKIGITITSAEDKYTLVINVDGIGKETFENLSTIANFLSVNSALVNITNPSGSNIVTATNTLLTGGTDAELSSYDEFFKAVKYKMYDYIAVEGADTKASDKVVAFVNQQINTKGKYVCGVVFDRPLLNNKYIISVDQGLECEDFTITTSLMPIFVASMRAGCPLGACLDNNDMTSLVGAKTIINPVDDDGDEAFIASLRQGKFLFAYWNDGTVVVEEDLNTYVEYVDNDPINHPADYRRNRLIATMNYIGNEATRRLNKNIVDGRHADDDEGNTRYLVKSIVDDICTELKNANVVGAYDPQTDIIVGSAGATDRLQYKTYLNYKDSIRQVYGEYNIVLA